MAGPAPILFSAPIYGNRRVTEWGMQEFQKRTTFAMRQFLTTTERWLTIVERNGPQGVERNMILEGRANSAEGYLASLHDPKAMNP